MVTLKNIHFGYGRQAVLKGIDTSFQPGHIYGLLGSNGTGKSTLLKNIAGLLFPDSGMIDVQGFRPGERKPGWLQQIFLLPEEFYLPGATIKKLIAGLAPFYPLFNKEDFYKYLYEFDIPVQSRLDEMSLGQKKKVQIAFGLACNTRLLLLDEPTNGLDIISKSQFRKVLAAMTNTDRYIIISTHQVQDIENLVDRIIVLHDGKLIFEQDIQTIAEKLSFTRAIDDEDLQQALYTDGTTKGSSIVSANLSGEEGAVDLELLYKSVIMNPSLINRQFN